MDGKQPVKKQDPMGGLMNRKMLVLNVAALSPWEIGPDCPTFESLANGGALRAMKAPEPALTCPSHATMLTGLEPRDHGIVANGWYDVDAAQVANWGRSDRLVAGEKIWEAAKRRAPDFKTVNLFWRFCPFECRDHLDGAANVFR